MFEGKIFAVIFICGNLFLQSTDSHEILLIKFSREWNSENDKKKEGKKNLTYQSIGLKLPAWHFM